MNRARHHALALLLMTASVDIHAAHRTPDCVALTDARAALDARAYTREQLLAHCLSRITRFDQHGPHINALIRVNPQALSQARQQDADTRRRGLLDGIPIILKDNFDTAQLPTSGGSYVLRDSLPATDAFAVQRLVDAGAIILAKANMSELAASYGRLGYSSAGGQTANPYNPLRDASGSSSGSAAAVAAGYAPAALGTDTSGSIRAPASVTGLVGLRPTLGLVSRRGIIPAALSFDTPGILAHRVEDVALLLQVLAGVDPQDAATEHQPPHEDYARALRDASQRSSLNGLRIGVVGNFRGGDPQVDAVIDAALARFGAHGVEFVPIDLPAVYETLWDSLLAPVSEAEFKPQFERYLRSLPAAGPRTLREFIDASRAQAGAASPTPINPARLAALEAADTTMLTDSPRYIDLLTRFLPQLRAQLAAIIEQNHLQALAFATMSCVASPRFDRTDASYRCESTDPYRAGYIAAAVGFPEISMPAGRAPGNLPVGLSLLGLPFDEARLLELAAALQAQLPTLPGPPLR